VREDESVDSEYCDDGELPGVIGDKSEGSNNTIVISKQISTYGTRLVQRCGTVCLNSFGNRTSPSYSSNDR